MIDSPFFSLIIPTYNRSGFITKTIQSVLTQDYGNFELLIVDDGSTDNTELIVNEISDLRLRYTRISNAERGAARNAGIKMARGKYISFLDSDDLLYADHFSVAFEFIFSHNFPLVFHIAYEIISMDGKALRKIDRLHDINNELAGGNPLSCMGVFVERNIMNANLFNEDRELAGLEDWELWLRIAAQQKIIACHKITSAIVQHDERSVLSVNIDKLILRSDKFIHYVLQDPMIKQVYGKLLDRTLASVKTYVALHIAIAKGPKKLIWSNFIEGVKIYPPELLRKRSFVIVKFLLA